MRTTLLPWRSWPRFLTQLLLASSRALARGAKASLALREEATTPDFLGCMTSLSAAMPSREHWGADLSSPTSAKSMPCQLNVTSTTSARGFIVGAMAWALRSVRSVSTASKVAAWPQPATFPCQATTVADIDASPFKGRSRR